MSLRRFPGRVSSPLCVDPQRGLVPRDLWSFTWTVGSCWSTEVRERNSFGVKTDRFDGGIREGLVSEFTLLY